MPESTRMELVAEANAEVIRACCGQAHEFGECPLDNDKKEEDR